MVFTIGIMGKFSKANGAMAPKRAREPGKIFMATHTQGLGRVIKPKAMVNIQRKMGINIKVIGLIA